ncbi:glycosyltransferase [bacterium]|nr:glycosyltransferase [bacterium]MCI0605777.1 glycosyltransferase [bacterium]
MKIHQLVPALHYGDAIGDSAQMIRNYLREKGHASEIYAYDIDEPVAQEAISFRKVQPELTAKDVLILHFALPSGMSDFLKQSQAKKAVIYHNVTPAYFWLPYDKALVQLATVARKQLADLAGSVDRAAGDSEYNRQELEKLNYRSTCVLPIFVDQERYRVEPSPFVQKTIQDELYNFLCVGRIAPNKKLEDVIRLYYFYKRFCTPLARLIFIGKTNVVPAYTGALKELTMRYGLMPEDVLFTGHVNWSELVAYYKSAHVLVSMSAHEGFCVPLVEAMICDTPILAYRSTAIPHTLGSAGIQFERKNYPELATMAHRLRENSAFRTQVLEGQREQLKRYSKVEVQKAIDEFLKPFL